MTQRSELSRVPCEPQESLAVLIRELVERVQAGDDDLRFALFVEDSVVLGPGPLDEIGMRLIREGVAHGIYTNVSDAAYALLLVRITIRATAKHSPQVRWQSLATHVLAMLGTSSERVSDAVAAAEQRSTV